MNAPVELKIFMVYLVTLIAAEIVTSLVSAVYGLFIHSVLLVTLIGLSAIWLKSHHSSTFFLCLAIAPLIRVFSLSLPLEYFPSYAWYLIAGIPMLAVAVTVIRLKGLTRKDVGLTVKNPWVQLAITFTGIPFGIMEYYILQPAPITGGFAVLALLLLAMGFIAATGFVEELVFRGVLQSSAVKTFGPRIGLLAVAAVFAVLHIGWLDLVDVVYVFVIGLFFGVLVLKTGSIAGVSLAHGLTNVFLFLVMPSITLISF
jgi:membrane protease YdiL (CAAX protease family)